MIEILPNWHPIFVHFTVALLTTSVIMFIFGYVLNTSKWRDQMLIVAHWNFWIGTASAVGTAIAGWIAYNTVTHDAASHAAMTVHRNWALGTLTAIFIVAIWLILSKRAWHKVSYPFLSAIFLTFSLLITTSWYGGELVYRYGLGVLSMPMMNKEMSPNSSDGHGSHEHGINKKQSIDKSNSNKQKVMSDDGHNHKH